MTSWSRRAKDQCPCDTQPVSRQQATCTEAPRMHDYLLATCELRVVMGNNDKGNRVVRFPSCSNLEEGGGGEKGH